MPAWEKSERNRMVAAFEIKWTPNVTSAHLSGLRSFAADQPDVPTYAVCTAENTYMLGAVKVLPWKKYLDDIEHWLK